MPVDGEKETVIERRVAEAPPTAVGSIASLLIVLGVIAAVALGWWIVGTTPAPDNRTSQAPAATSDTTSNKPL
jgi:hypothetical protein